MITAQKQPTARISPKQMHDAGYRDGLNRRKNYDLYRANAEYRQGYQAGYRANPSSLFNLEIPAQALLERGWGGELLNGI